MKIAILTQPLRTNYGGILQAYALQTVLQRMGHEVVVVNREYQDYPNIKLLCLRIGAVIKSAVRRYILGRKEYIVMNPFSSLFRTRWIGYVVLPFVRQRICQSPELRNSASMRRYFAKQKFDCYIVGSDQVWRPCYSPCITDFFLGSMPENSKAKRIAYAASFGTDKWEMTLTETKECATLAGRFDAISVREASGVDLCKQYLGVNAVHLLDPTLLLDAKDYINLLNETDIHKGSGNLFCYILDSSAEVKKIIRLLEGEGMSLLDANMDMVSYTSSHTQLSVEEWLLGLYNADFVITDSFHASVFAILFKKPFLVYGNNVRGMTRVKSLLKIFGLQNRLITSVLEFEQRRKSLFESLDSNNLDLVLKEWKDKSYHFLKEYLQ